MKYGVEKFNDLESYEKWVISTKVEIISVIHRNEYKYGKFIVTYKHLHAIN